jgi:MFS family permease
LRPSFRFASVSISTFSQHIPYILTTNVVGALALSAESIVAALTPVFALEYSHLDPKILGKTNLSSLSPPGVVNLNPLSTLNSLGGPPIWRINLISSLPLLTNGLASYFLVPLSISIGRRPVLLLCGVFAWVGGFWAGASRSLSEHIGARCLQGLGAGAVEALIPLAVQDIVFIHQRNRAVSSIWATQGVLIVGLGIAAPVIVLDMSWRWIYYFTATFALISWVALCFFLPETRWMRSNEELSMSESGLFKVVELFAHMIRRWSASIPTRARRSSSPSRCHNVRFANDQNRHWILPKWIRK